VPVEVNSVSSDNDFACVGCDIEFTATTSPSGHEGDVSWSAPGGDPNSGSGSSFSTSWDTPGPNTVTASICDSNDSKQVTIVKVDKLQYNDPNDGYTDISGTLYVHTGTTVTFKAIPDPCDASWPSGKPVWGGTSGASGTGETTPVTFNTLSSSTTDYNTVTATCGNTVTANVIVFDFNGVLTPNVQFDGRSFSQYGVEETVSLSYTTDPTGITGLPLEWEVSSGVGSVSGSTYDAEAVAGSVTLRLELQSGPSKGQGYNYSKTVVAPTNIYVHAYPPWDGIWHEEDSYSCGFKGESYLAPYNVSFTNIQRREGTSPPATVTGHYEDHYGTPGPTHPVRSWFTPSNPDSDYGCYVARDTCSTYHSSSCGATLGDSGTFIWVIDYEYKGDDSVVRNMGTITHNAEMESDGTAKVKKGSVGWYSKEFGDPDSSYYTD